MNAIRKRLPVRPGKNNSARDYSARDYSEKSNQYIETLRAAGHRITDQRIQICQYLAQTDQHPTPYQVYAALQAIDRAISRATVYNTLNTLQQLGAIVEINFGANHTHYDTDPKPHVNLICLRCHAIEDCHCELHVDQPLQATVAQYGFQAVATKVDILGYCQACQEAMSTA